jgi:hypothetical protein
MGKLHFIVQQPVKLHMKCVPRVLLISLMIVALPACISAAGSSLEDPVAAASPVASSTPTIVWFPPSPTPTPQTIPTTYPTPEMKPGVGAQLLADDFSSAAPWNPAVSDEASVSVGRNRLTIAVQPGVTAFRVRQGSIFGDFYAEITAQASLCRDADDYGLLYRAPNSVAYYAFVVSCDGTARAERVRLGKPFLLHSPQLSADAPPGAPGEVRLGVWASGSFMRFFLNGHYQFSIEDPAYKAGSLGAFAHSAADTPVTVLFSDLAVYKVSYLALIGTPTP